MRVLLPLRQVSANKQTSDSETSDTEEGQQQERSESCVALIAVDVQLENQEVSVSASPPDPKSKPAQQATLPVESKQLCLEQKPSAHPEPSVARKQSKDKKPASTKITGLENTLGLESANQPHLGSALVPAKRKAVGVDPEGNLSKKRTPLDRKPPARELNIMVAAGRRPSSWLNHDDDSLRDSAPETMSRESYDTNPASDGGDSSDEQDFVLALKKRGFEIREQDGDGNCLFRAVSLQVYGDPSMHSDVRKKCMDFMDRDREHFSQFVTGEPFPQYIERKRQEGVHGNNPEIQAISELFNRPVEVFCPDKGATPLNIFHAEYKTADAPIRLSYHDGNHYNAVVDPLVPTAGLGLGLPGLQPGLADKLQVAKAVAESDAAADLKRAVNESEEDELQRAIKESKLTAEHRCSNEAMTLSDMDATYFELEQAALERSLHAYAVSDHGKKQKASTKPDKKTEQETRDTDTLDLNSSKPSSRDSSPAAAVASLPVNSSSIGDPDHPPVVAYAAAAAATLPAASIPTVASASVPAAAGLNEPPTRPLGSVDQYPQAVQELVMNGFDLSKVVRAYDLIGDNFDDLLAVLMSNSR